MSAERIEAIKPMLGDIAGFAEQVQAEAQAAADRSEADAAESVIHAAMVEAAYLMAVSDGEVTQEEADSMAAGIVRITDGLMPQDQLQTFYEVATGRFENEGLDARIAAVGNDITDPNLRRAVFSVAVALTWLDGGIGVKQGLAIQALARAFEIPTHEMQVLLGKAKGH